MKKLTLLFLALTLGINLGFSQTKRKEGAHRTPQERAEKVTNKLAETLALSEDQRKRVFEIILERETNREEIRLDQAADKKKKHQQMAARNKKTDDQLKAILSQEQFNKLEQERREKIAKRKENRQGNSKEKSPNASEEVDDESDL